MEEFINNIMQNLRSNGFPEKKVSLPTERMYEAADAKGFSFNRVLEQLKLDHRIDATIGPERVIFSQTKIAPENTIKQAQEMMAKMDPEELKQLQDMFMNMSEEQKSEIFQKGKDLGLL